jgi:hypothetical protein
MRDTWLIVQAVHSMAELYGEVKGMHDWEGSKHMCPCNHHLAQRSCVEGQPHRVMIC